MLCHDNNDEQHREHSVVVPREVRVRYTYRQNGRRWVAVTSSSARRTTQRRQVGSRRRNYGGHMSSINARE